jgi:hypothetical protein
MQLCKPEPTFGARVGFPDGAPRHVSQIPHLIPSRFLLKPWLHFPGASVPSAPPVRTLLTLQTPPAIRRRARDADTRRTPRLSAFFFFYSGTEPTQPRPGHPRTHLALSPLARSSHELLTRTSAWPILPS